VSTSSKAKRTSKLASARKSESAATQQAAGSETLEIEILAGRIRAAQDDLAREIVRQGLAAASEIREVQAGYVAQNESGSAALDEPRAADFGALTEESRARIEGNLRTLQEGLSRIEAKFEVLAR
jgi:hypothetical protein